MFDKNSFKDAFRSWVQNNPDATEDDARAFCQIAIPAHAYHGHYWLVEQSLQWFHWLKAQRALEAESLAMDGDDGEEGGRILC